MGMVPPALGAPSEALSIDAEVSEPVSCLELLAFFLVADGGPCSFPITTQRGQAVTCQLLKGTG